MREAVTLGLMQHPTVSTSIAIPSPRRRLSDDTRRQLLARYHRSDLTQRAFCEQAGLPLSTFQWWLVQARRAATRPARAVAFAEIVAPACADLGRDTQPVWAVEISTTRGLTIRLRSPLAPTALGRLLRDARC
jgi:transposase-like protein